MKHFSVIKKNKAGSDAERSLRYISEQDHSQNNYIFYRPIFVEKKNRYICKCTQYIPFKPQSREQKMLNSQ